MATAHCLTCGTLLTTAGCWQCWKQHIESEGSSVFTQYGELLIRRLTGHANAFDIAQFILARAAYEDIMAHVVRPETRAQYKRLSETAALPDWAKR